MAQRYADGTPRGQCGDPTHVAGSLGAFVRARRRHAGLTQTELARRSGVGLGTVRDLEQGRTGRPSSPCLRRLAAALAVGVGEEELTRNMHAMLDAAANAGDRRSSRARLEVLGPLAAWRRGKLVAPIAAKHRVILGVLAVAPNTWVHQEALIDAVWGERSPTTAVSLVRTYVSALRRILDPKQSPRDQEGLVVAAGSGYRLQVTADQLDLLAFEQLAERGRAECTRGDLVGACHAYERALNLWHGELLADVDVLRNHPAAVSVRRHHATVICDYADAACAARLPDRVLPHLWDLASREPLDEKVHARLMIALASAGRQAAALKVFEDLRSRLDAELGVCPGPELAASHLRVLRQDVLPTVPQAVIASISTALASEAAPAVPRELPAVARYFAGRQAELTALNSLLDQPARSAERMLISAISGTAGVGKTAMAVYWAHQVADRFPDGQLFANLRGYDRGQPVSAADALAGFLHALGMPDRDIPSAVDERAARYRSLLADRRILVILDNAGSAEQVRPLLPGAQACMAVVTSRDSLAGLVARDGAWRLELDPLPPGDAIELLRALIGARVTAEPAAAATMAARCCRLPLALRIAAELAAARPRVPLAELAGQLDEQQRCLEFLSAGEDTSTAVRTVFSWSCRHLNHNAARMFRLSGLHPGPDLDRHAAAVLVGSTAEQAEKLLGQLVRAHLIQVTKPGRYGMHDLLRAYAAEQSGLRDSAGQRRAALTRLLDHYSYVAADATDTLFPAESGGRQRIRPPVAPVLPMTDPATARAWLDAERANLVAVVAYSSVHGWPEHATRLAATLFRYLDAGGHYSEAIAIYGHARSAASQVGILSAEAEALMSLGIVDLRLGRYQQGVDHLNEALALFRDTGNHAGELRALGVMGIADFLQGRCRQAIGRFQLAMGLSRDIGDQPREARALNNLGLVELRQGRYQEAFGHFQQAMDRCQSIGDQADEAHVLANLGDVELRQGRYQQALAYLQQALVLFRETGNPIGEGYALTSFGDVELRQGRYQQALAYLQQALVLFRETGHRPGEAGALNSLGEVLLSTGQPFLARAQHASALTLTSYIGDKYEEARALNGLAHAYHAAGDVGQAHWHWQEAFTRYVDIGAPEANQVHAWLEAGDHAGHHAGHQGDSAG
jgi:DNA-binding SARP family transcriptional activator/tetratricopeptide (TPR) repeat protein